LPERTQKRELTEEEKLKVEFLKKLRSLGGSYFEYYSVYLLERYCMKNGRRLEGLKISGGDADGGIDGEISLTDRMGFKEVIYIQAKNWDPSKGDPDKWVVGETLLQQFVGAVTCRQAREGKRKCRGIFVTTSRFTEGAKEILNSLSADFVGYDGDDVFEAAKECLFGIVEKNGKLCLDEKLLSGEKAFFGIL
jgi:restriction system protein